MLATVRDGSVRLISRNGHSFTNLFWPISDALRGFPTSLLIDGEVIAINDQGRPDFEALQQRLRPRNGNLPGYLCYMVFDLLYVNGHSPMGQPVAAGLERYTWSMKYLPGVTLDEAGGDVVFMSPSPLARRAPFLPRRPAPRLRGRGPRS